jgi:CRP-like cAMP-binding protein
MSALPLIATRRSPVARRLSSLATLSPGDLAAIEAAERAAMPVRIRRDLVVEKRPITESKLIVSGWAARVRVLYDGRRQFLSFLLPGDLVGHCAQSDPVAVCSVVALTDMLVTRAPDSDGSPGLTEAYAVSRALDEAYLLAQIVRLGRYNALERIADLILELEERLSCARLTTGGRFRFPLTQETLADALGLTSVHTNRMLQSLRRTGDLILRGGEIYLPDLAALRARVGRLPVVVRQA